MNIFGADLARPNPAEEAPEWTLVALDRSGKIRDVRRPSSIGALITEISAWTGDDPFLLGVDIPVVLPARETRTRPFEGVLRKKLGVRIPPGGRAALPTGERSVTGEKLLAGLAGAGLACLTWPDKNRRTSALAEIHPAPALKSLFWIDAALGAGLSQEERAELCRATPIPAYAPVPGKRSRRPADLLFSLDLLVRALAPCSGFDFQPVADLLKEISDEAGAGRAASLLNACLIAGTARRYLDAPETCVFCGERESGYTILPSDDFLRRILVAPASGPKRKLFPQATLEERLGKVADLLPLDLLKVRGKPEKLQAVFREPPCYEFENVDEMLWWKRCRHVEGPPLPTEGLLELSIRLAGEEDRLLNLVRSRHTALSFRFEPPGAWRRAMRPRDNRVYRFQVLRASYETETAGYS